MSNPFFSVITVTYNSSQFVRDAIESVLASTYTEFELIIGDDCSTDNTWDIINEYNDQRIIKYRNETNLREYPNRNKALSMAKGEWVIFIDGDDVIFEHGLASFEQFITQYEDVSMVIQKDYFNNIIWPVNLEPKQFLVNEFFGQTRLSCSSFASNVFKRSALISIGNLSTNYKTGDEDIRLRIGANNKTLFIPGWLTWPRETPGQASKSISTSKMFIERSEQVSCLLSDIAKDSELFEIIQSGYLFQLSQLKKVIYSLLINFEFSEISSLISFFGFLNIFIPKKVKIKYIDQITNCSPSNPYH